MRLPANKQDRQKVLALIALGGVAALYGLWVGVYQPISRKMDEASTTIIVLQTNLGQAPQQIRQLADMRADLVKTMRALRTHSEQHLLNPRLGNYLLPARDFLVKKGTDAGVEAIQVTDIGLIDPPAKAKPVPKPAAAAEPETKPTPGAAAAPAKKEPAGPVRVYSARVTAECGYDTFIEWVRALQADNPLIAISHFLITAQPDNPQRHLVRFEVQWPVWTDPDMQAKVSQKADEILGGATP